MGISQMDRFPLLAAARSKKHTYCTEENTRLGQTQTGMVDEEFPFEPPDGLTKDEQVDHALRNIRDRIMCGDLAVSPAMYLNALSIINAISDALGKGWGHYHPVTEEELTEMADILRVLRDHKQVLVRRPKSDTD